MASYNGKDKAVGVASFDIGAYLNKNLLKSNDSVTKLPFTKCFDKQASISFQLKFKEIFNAINESVNEDVVNEESEMSQIEEKEMLSDI